MKIDMQTWIISDTHFRHNNIIKYCGRPTDHDNIMWKNWNTVVGHDDVILHLGDVATWYGDTAGAANILTNLPGEKYLILGNHDKLDSGWYTDLGFNIGYPFTQVFEGLHFGVKHPVRVHFSHYPETENLDWDINIHGHIHNNGYPPNADPLKDYRNVSVEVMNYEPVRLHEVLFGGRFASHKTLGFDTEKLRKRRP